MITPLRPDCSMNKLLFVILIFISTCAVVAHPILAYQYSAIQTLIAEEENHEEKPGGKEAKDFSKDKLSFTSYLYRHALTSKLLSSIFNSPIKYSKGFFDKPYNPPDFS